MVEAFFPLYKTLQGLNLPGVDLEFWDGTLSNNKGAVQQWWVSAGVKLAFYVSKVGCVESMRCRTTIKDYSFNCCPIVLFCILGCGHKRAT
jgi:hypothetical protein